MSQFAKNIIFIGRLLYLRDYSNKLLNFNISNLARDLGVSSEAVKKWIDGGNISSTSLERIAPLISSLLNINISANDLLNNDIEKLYNDSNIIKDRADFYCNINNEIIKCLEKHPEMQTIVLDLLKTYENKSRNSFINLLLDIYKGIENDRFEY